MLSRASTAAPYRSLNRSLRSLNRSLILNGLWPLYCPCCPRIHVSAREPLNKRRKRVDLVRQGSGWSSFRCAGLLEQAFSRSWVRLYVIFPLSRRSDAVVVSNAAAADTD